MSRERWGTFSVIDHQRPRPFVAEVLLYDRLIIPVPSDAAEQKRWSEVGREPDKLDRNLEILGELAVHVPWDEPKRDAFKTRFSAAKLAAIDANYLAQAKQMNWDPLYVTRALLAHEFLPELPHGVTKVWPLAAYPSLSAYQEDARLEGSEEQSEKLAMVLTTRFLIPEDPGKSDAEMLKKAGELAKREDFREKRAKLHRWQEDIIEQEIPPDKAVEEMEDYLKQYNQVVQRATKEVYWKFAFMAVPVAVSIATAGLGAPLVVASATGLISIAAFAKLDRKPRIDAGDCEAAAVIHDFQNHFERP